MTRKIILITLACSLLIAYGVWQTRLNAQGGYFGHNFRAQNVDVGVQVPSGCKFVRSYESRVNGAAAPFAHYISAMPAAPLVDRFLAQKEASDTATAAARKVPRPQPNIIRGSGCIATAWPEGSHVVSVIAFDSPRGCNFFVSRSPLSPAANLGRKGQDAPGVDAPGVPRPLNAARMMSAENIGGIPSVLAFYEGSGGVADNVDHFRAEMSRQGWKENALQRELMNMTLDGETLSFRSGIRFCLIHIEREPRSGKVTTAVLYREKEWLGKENNEQ